MIKRMLILALLIACCLCGAALADANFTFSEHRFSLFEGETLSIELLRQGAAAEGSVTWTSSNQRVATVDDDGLVTARAKGETTIRAQVRANGRNYSTTATVTVLRAVTGLTVDERRLTVLQPDDPRLAGVLTLTYDDPEDERYTYPVLVLRVNAETTLSIAMEPAGASSTRAQLTADDGGAVLRISNRTVTAKAPGECILRIASQQNPEIFVCYHVLAVQRVRSVSVSLERRMIGVGGTTVATASVSPDSAAIRAVEWSTTTPRIISVTPDGVVTALARGTGKVKATALDGSNVSGEATVTVGIMPTAVQITRSSPTVAAGNSVNFSASVTPNNAVDRGVVWSSTDPGVASVNANGRVTGVRRGTAVIICTAKADPAVSAAVEVTVTQPVERITASPNRMSVHVGESAELGWSVTPADADNAAVTFTSDKPRIASVDANGMVTGVSRGEARITIRAADGSNRTAAVTVTVQQPVTGITLRHPAVTVVAGQRTTLNATVTPSNANNKRLTWTTSDPSIATVDGEGRVRGVKAGFAVVTCASVDSPEVTAVCAVTVVQRVTSITLNPPTLELRVGESAVLSWLVHPDDATDKSVTFRSGDTRVAAVDPDGTVHARARGECTITCRAADGSDKTARTRVTVIQPVEGVHMENSQVTVDVGEQLTIRAVLEPSNASINRMTWTSADPSVATVEGGTNRPTVRGMAWGDTILTGVTQDGGFSTVCFVHVGTYAKALEITDVYLRDNQIKLAVRNNSNLNVSRFFFTVEVLDLYDNPLPCTTSGQHFFTGYYLDVLPAGMTTTHGRFHFDDFMPTAEPIGTVTITLTGYYCDNGFSYLYEQDEMPVFTFRSEQRIGPLPGPEENEGTFTDPGIL